jgi:hypothetical protein
MRLFHAQEPCSCLISKPRHRHEHRNKKYHHSQKLHHHDCGIDKESLRDVQAAATCKCAVECDCNVPKDIDASRVRQDANAALASALTICCHSVLTGGQSSGLAVLFFRGAKTGIDCSVHFSVLPVTYDRDGGAESTLSGNISLSIYRL